MSEQTYSKEPVNNGDVVDTGYGYRDGRGFEHLDDLEEQPNIPLVPFSVAQGHNFVKW